MVPPSNDLDRNRATHFPTLSIVPPMRILLQYTLQAYY